MHYRSFFLTAIILSPLILQCTVPPKMTFHQTKIIAHRGAWKAIGTSQNSVASLKEAIAKGYFGSETDVHLTADSQLVINHDATWGGLTVQKSTLAVLRKTKLSNGEELPLLSDFLKIIKKQNRTKLILEIKPSERGREWANATVRKIIDAVHQFKNQRRIIYISFDYEICKEILKLEPFANVQYLNGDKAPADLKKDRIKGADYHYSVFRKHPEWITQAKELGIDINAWTVDNSETMDWLLANNADYITTNEPELLFEEIKKSPTSQGWKMIWNDEFDYSGLPDSSKWGYETGGNGWGNNEKQYYSDADTNNAIVKDGVLSIIVRKEKRGNNEYTSARLTTKGKGDWKYGRTEVRAKLPAGRGLWPAIWMLNSDVDKVGWPDCGEIDIMEHVGFAPDSIFGTVHTKAFNHLIGTQKSGDIIIDHFYDRYHVFAMDWSPEKIEMFADGEKYFEFKNEHKTLAEWPFNSPFYLILNVAVGGNLGGKKGIDDSIFPATYKIDYVRVFQRE